MRFVLLELAGVRLVLEGELSADELARVHEWWTCMRRVVAPTLREAVVPLGGSDALHPRI